MVKKTAAAEMSSKPAKKVKLVKYTGGKAIIRPAIMREVKLDTGAEIRVARFTETPPKRVSAGYTGDGSKGFSFRFLSPELAGKKRTELRFSLTDNATVALCFILHELLTERPV
jgi:hypothetical protein